MTKEQEIAIKYLEMMLERMDFNQFGYIYAEDSLRTVLNMLKDQQREIKTLTQTNKSYKGMINKKDKQIDLMAETIRKLAISLASYEGSYNKETINFTGNIKDIKQYFEQKATKNS